VLKEAKDADIPVILVDRKASVDQSLYITLIGSDFYEEGVNACKKMAKLLNETGTLWKSEEIQARILQ
jgi:simple sugar transport system substrate-binding protein